MSWDRDAEGVQREETWDKCPLTIRLGVRGSVISSPSWVWGGAPAENGFYAYFRSQRSPLEHHFQYFWATAGPPKRRGARENSPLTKGLRIPLPFLKFTKGSCSHFLQEANPWTNIRQSVHHSKQTRSVQICSAFQNVYKKMHFCPSAYAVCTQYANTKHTKLCYRNLRVRVATDLGNNARSQ